MKRQSASTEMMLFGMKYKKPQVLIPPYGPQNIISPHPKKKKNFEQT